MASVKALTDLSVVDLWREVKDEATLWGDVSRVWCQHQPDLRLPARLVTTLELIPGERRG